MTTAAMATYAYDQIDQARENSNTPAKFPRSVPILEAVFWYTGPHWTGPVQSNVVLIRSAAAVFAKS